MNNFPIKFADDLICYNVIGTKDKEDEKTIGYFTIARDYITARSKLIELISNNTDPKDPFKLWKDWSYNNGIKPIKIRTKINQIEVLMEKTEEHQEMCIRELKKLFHKPSKDLVGNDDIALWTYLHCSKRQYNLFDPDGAAIEDRKYLNDVLSKYKDYKNFKGSLFFQEFNVKI